MKPLFHNASIVAKDYVSNALIGFLSQSVRNVSLLPVKSKKEQL
jgi:hypothetical protein